MVGGMEKYDPLAYVSPFGNLSVCHLDRAVLSKDLKIPTHPFTGSSMAVDGLVRPVGAA